MGHSVSLEKIIWPEFCVNTKRIKLGLESPLYTVSCLVVSSSPLLTLNTIYMLINTKLFSPA